MHMMITKTKYKGKVKEYAKIVQSYWDGKISKPKLILNLGPINSEDDRIRFNEILSKLNKGKEFVDLSSIEAKDAKEFGVTYTTSQLLQKYKVEEILQNYLSKNRAKFDVYQIIKALIINRLVDPSSDLSAADWITKHYSEETKVEEQYIYRALSYLIKYKE